MNNSNALQNVLRYQNANPNSIKTGIWLTINQLEVLANHLKTIQNCKGVRLEMGEDGVGNKCIEIIPFGSDATCQDIGGSPTLISGPNGNQYLTDANGITGNLLVTLPYEIGSGCGTTINNEGGGGGGVPNQSNPPK